MIRCFQARYNRAPALLKALHGPHFRQRDESIEGTHRRWRDKVPHRRGSVRFNVRLAICKILQVGAESTQ